MLTEAQTEQLKHRIACEVRAAFTRPEAPKYDFTLEEAIETLFDLLHHDFGFEGLESVGESIQAGFLAYEQTGDLTTLVVKIEPFCMMLLRLISPFRYERLWQEATKRQPAQKPGLAALLKRNGLSLATNDVLASQPETLHGRKRFAEHVSRVFVNRNVAAHEAKAMSSTDRARLFESICVVLLFAVAEYRRQIQSALLVEVHRAYLERIRDLYQVLGERYLELEASEPSRRGRSDYFTVTGATQQIVLPPGACGRRIDTTSISVPTRPITNLIGLIDRHPRLSIQGEPGAGKTTAMRCFAYRRATQLLNEPGCGLPFPVYLELKYCRPGAGKTIRQKMERLLQCDVCLDVFLQQNVQLLLDGFNEVSAEDQHSVALEVAEIAEEFPKLRIAITTRYSKPVHGMGHVQVNVRPLADEQIRQYLHDRIGARENTEGLIKSVMSIEGVRQWVQNPLHLSFVADCIGAESSIPASLGKLVKRCVARFLDRECRQSDRQLTGTVKESLLSGIAFEASTKGVSYFEFSQAIKWLKSAGRRVGVRANMPEVLEQFEDNGLLVRNEDNLYSFGHDLYHSFFTAVEMVNRDKEGRLALDSDSPILYRWDTLRFFCDLSEDPTRALKSLMSLNPISGFFAFTDEVESKPETKARILECAVQNLVEGKQVFWSVVVFHLLREKGSLVRALKTADFSNTDLQVQVCHILRELSCPAAGSSELGADQALLARFAELLLQALSDAGLSELICDIGLVLEENGYSEAAVRCYDASRKLGNIAAKLNFGVCLVNGRGTERNEGEGLKCILECAETGDVQAMRLAGLLLAGWTAEQFSIPADVREGANWVRKAADAGDPESMRILGVRLLDGLGIEKDLARGENWLRRAAGSGNVCAMAELGRRLLYGLSLASHPEEGEHWLCRAIELGNVNAAAALGGAMVEGTVLERDLEEGERLLRGAADRENSDAMFLLGEFLLEGILLSGNSLEGCSWLRKAAEVGHTLALKWLGLRLLLGCGVESDRDEAEKYLERYKRAFAAFCLGWVDYLREELVPAAFYFAEAFMRGESAALQNLIFMQRRRELPFEVEKLLFTVSDWEPDIENLTSTDIIEEVPPFFTAQYQTFHRLNVALCQAAGFHCPQSWEGLGRPSVMDPKFAMAYWNRLARQNDPDGHLILAALVRRGLIEDPEKMSLAERVALARDGGWQVPDWMEHPPVDVGDGAG